MSTVAKSSPARAGGKSIRSFIEIGMANDTQSTKGTRYINLQANDANDWSEAKTKSIIILQ